MAPRVRANHVHEIVGLLMSRRGVYRFEDRDASHLTPDERADIRSRRLGFVFQSYNLLSGPAARERRAAYGLRGRARARSQANRSGKDGDRRRRHLRATTPTKCRRTTAARRDRARARQLARAHFSRRADRALDTKPRKT